MVVYFSLETHGKQHHCLSSHVSFVLYCAIEVLFRVKNVNFIYQFSIMYKLYYN